MILSSFYRSLLFFLLLIVSLQSMTACSPSAAMAQHVQQPLPLRCEQKKNPRQATRVRNIRLSLRHQPPVPMGGSRQAVTIRAL